MEQELFKLASSDSLWAALFVVLFLYTIYDSKNREKSYQSTIQENQKIIQGLTGELLVDIRGTKDSVIEMKQDVKRIKDNIERRG